MRAERRLLFSTSPHVYSPIRVNRSQLAHIEQLPSFARRARATPPCEAHAFKFLATETIYADLRSLQTPLTQEMLTSDFGRTSHQLDQASHFPSL